MARYIYDMLSLEHKKQIKDIERSIDPNTLVFEVLKKFSNARTIFFEDFYRAAINARRESVPHGSQGERDLRRELLRFFRRLHAAGLGKLVVGRKGAQTRFIWSVAAADVLGFVFADEQPLRAAEPPGPEYGAAVKTITHRFALRPGLPIQFDLPADLTANEAIRLAAFLRALPFEPYPKRSLDKLLALSGTIDLGATDISENIHKYAAEAYEDKE